MTEPNPFADAVEQATAARTAADAANTAASLDQQMVAFEQRVANGDYGTRTDLIERTRTALQATRVAAGLTPTPPVKTVQQLAAEFHNNSFPLEDTLNPNLETMLAADRADLDNDAIARDAAERQLRTQLGAPVYQKLLSDASKYKVLTASEKAHLPSLRTYSVIGVRNQYKRSGKIN